MQPKINHSFCPIDHRFSQADRFPVFLVFDRFAGSWIAARDGVVTQSSRLQDIRGHGNVGRQAIEERSEVVGPGKGNVIGDQNGFEGLFSRLLGMKAERSSRI